MYLVGTTAVAQGGRDNRGEVAFESETVGAERGYSADFGFGILISQKFIDSVDQIAEVKESFASIQVTVWPAVLVDPGQAYFTELLVTDYPVLTNPDSYLSAAATYSWDGFQAVWFWNSLGAFNDGSEYLAQIDPVP